MPDVKDYKGKKKATKRRPHREEPELQAAAEELEAQPDLQADEVENSQDDINTEAQNEGVSVDEPEKTDERIHLEFYGSEMIRQRAPKIMDLADVVATEWTRDGQFEDLPLLENPLAQLAAAKALRTAKDVEKKLEEKGVLAMARKGFDYAKSRINTTSKKN